MASLAAISLAKDMGLYVVATTRHTNKASALLANGADDVIIDTGQLARVARERVPSAE